MAVAGSYFGVLHVDFSVSFLLIWPCEAASADVAAERFFASVGTDMGCQVVASWKRSMTNSTLEQKQKGESGSAKKRSTIWAETVQHGTVVEVPWGRRSQFVKSWLETPYSFSQTLAQRGDC